MGRRLGLVVVRFRRAFKNHIDKLQSGLPILPCTGASFRLDLCPRLSRVEEMALAHARRRDSRARAWLSNKPLLRSSLRCGDDRSLVVSASEVPRRNRFAIACGQTFSPPGLRVLWRERRRRGRLRRSLRTFLRQWNAWSSDKLVCESRGCESAPTPFSNLRGERFGP